jgi:hypothetical protein
MANGNAGRDGSSSDRGEEREIAGGPFLALCVPRYNDNASIATAGRNAASNEEVMAANHDRLLFKLFHLVEGEAEGRFGIAALVALMLAALIVTLVMA